MPSAKARSTPVFCNTPDAFVGGNFNRELPMIIVIISGANVTARR